MEPSPINFEKILEEEESPAKALLKME
jgi:hypothetical protein